MFRSLPQQKIELVLLLPCASGPLKIRNNTARQIFPRRPEMPEMSEEMFAARWCVCGARGDTQLVLRVSRATLKR